MTCFREQNFRDRDSQNNRKSLNTEQCFQGTVQGLAFLKSRHCKLELEILSESCLFELKVLDAFAVQVLPRS